MTATFESLTPERAAELDAIRAFHAEAHATGVTDCMVAHNMYLTATDARVTTVTNAAQVLAMPEYRPGPETTIDEHITNMWPVLRRPGNTDLAGSIPVPNDVYAPGERFIDSYYWDGLEIMRGLAAEGQWDEVRKIINNCAHLIETYGYIPNGTRTYFEGRSQPPVFAEMVEFLAEHEGLEAVVRYLPAMQKEHAFFMAGEDTVSPEGDPPAHRRVVARRGADGRTHILNRFYDDTPGPRDELICKDDETIKEAVEKLGADPTRVALDIRAACESGWDFSSRWLANGKDLYTICTTSIIPVDLNCNLLHLERMIARGLELTGDFAQAADYEARATARADAIQEFCWNEEEGFFFDYNFEANNGQGAQTDIWSLAGMYPLDMGIATPEQAERVLDHMEHRFLQDGGLMSSLTINSGQQWDGRNGFAPLQFRGARAAWRNGRADLAELIRTRTMFAYEEVFRRWRFMAEKVDVFDVGEPGNDGEYPCQEGFGWTNGVYRAFQRRMHESYSQIIRPFRRFTPVRQGLGWLVLDRPHRLAWGDYNI